MAQYKVRRDYSVNNVPVVGYQDSADAQDTILWGLKQVADTGLTSDANGIVRVTKAPIVDMSHDFVVDGSGTGRERKLDAKDITIGGGTYYIGDVDGKAGTIKLYTDIGLTTSAANKTGISATYWTLQQLSIDSYGRLKIIVDNGSAINVNVDDTTPVDVNIAGASPITSDAPATVKAYFIDYTGYHPVCANPDTEVRQAPFKASSFGPLAVTGFNLIWSGRGWQRLRVAALNKKFDIKTSAAAITPIWTPLSGYKFRLMKMIVSNHATSPVRFWLKDGGTGCTCDMTVPPQSTIQLDFGQGIKSSTANNVLGFACNSACEVGVMCSGIEEQ